MMRRHLALLGVAALPLGACGRGAPAGPAQPTPTAAAAASTGEPNPANPCARLRFRSAFEEGVTLSTCFFPIDGRRALYYPPAFTEASRARLAEAFDDLIEAPEADPLRFSCNTLLVDGTVVVNTGCDATVAALEARGYACLATSTDEFIKAGGSVKCLVLTLNTFEGAPGH